MTDPHNIKDRSVSNIEQVLEEHNLALFFITDGAAIHHIEYDEGQLSYIEGGSHGYDEETSRSILENVLNEEGVVKLVPESEIRSEHEALMDGEWETPTEWAEDTYEVAV